MRTGLRNLAKNLLVAVLPTLLLLGAVEIVLRLSGLAPTTMLRGADYSHWEGQPGPYRAGERLRDRSKPQLPYGVTINALGFRVPEVSSPKAPGTFRIVCLGDSYTFGAGVEDDESWPWRLQRRLREARPDRAPEVVNAGVPGFTIRDDLILMREKGPLLSADAVLLQFTQNDISDLSKAVPNIRQMEQHARVKARPVLGTTLRLLQHTATFNGLQRLLAVYRARHGGNPAVPRIDAVEALTAPSARPLWEAYAHDLRELRDLLAKSGTPLAVINYPGSFQLVDGADATPRQRLQEMAEELGLPYLDLHPALRDARARGEKLYLLPIDAHPSPRGYQVAADAIAAFVVDRWLPGLAAGGAVAPQP